MIENKKINLKKIDVLLVLIVVSFILRLLFAVNHELLAEEAYYWNYTQHLDLGYLDHPPLVAVLIKCSTTLFGINEWGVRFPAVLCWLICAYFSYRWCELCHRGSGVYALFLLSILPFFFLYSLIMTPDLPLMASWSAALFYLYRVLVLSDKNAWYYAGLAVGIGLLGKYSIVLLLFTTFMYMLCVADARHWLRRKEPYGALAIVILVFTPVIYWNMTHHWASFSFQSTRRFQGDFHCSLHQLLGLVLLYLTPIGCIGLYQLVTRYGHSSTKKNMKRCVTQDNRRFFQWYTLLPLAIFASFSLTRDIKSNWIGPGLLALIPWLTHFSLQQAFQVQRWLKTGLVLIIVYAGLIFCIVSGQPRFVNRLLFSKMISWDELTTQFETIAQLTTPAHEVIRFIPLDNYSIASELLFYHTKHEAKSLRPYPFKVHGAYDIFAFKSLMFDAWFPSKSLVHTPVILIGKTLDDFRPQATTPLSPIKKIWGKSQGSHAKLKPFYYQRVMIN